MIIEGLDDVANYIQLNSEDQSNDDSDDGTNFKGEPR
jgi:hypothetical protein